MGQHSLPLGQGVEVGLSPRAGAKVKSPSLDYQHPHNPKQVPVWPQKTKGKQKIKSERKTQKKRQ